MLDTTSSPALLTTHPRQLSGLFLSKTKLSAKGRAQLAAAVLDGRAVLTRLTAGQIAGLCRVSTSSVAAARTGRIRRPVDLRLAKMWNRATPQQRLDFIRHAGPDAVWTALAATL
jgi:hypothetical protein